MIKELITIANSLDEKGLKKEADYLDSIIKKAMNSFDDEGPSDAELDAIEREFKGFEDEEIDDTDLLMSAMDIMNNPDAPEFLKKKFRLTIQQLLNEALMHGGGLSHKMNLGGPGLAPSGNIIAEAKRKLTKKH
tara:strand:+ start:7426 stop:7827 length:402 start_codon:yes stop_codon:yes gene_type:complete